jgi:dihydroorotase
MAVSRLLLRRTHLLEGPGIPCRQADVEIVDGRIVWMGPAGQPPVEGPSPSASGAPAQEVCGEGLWLAPTLVDPHSVLEDPVQGRAETLSSLRSAAARGGYGTVALLPWAECWRDRPERLDLEWADPMRLHLWGSFSLNGADQDLAGHLDQLAAGAIGIAGVGHHPPIDLLERGLRLGEMGDRPVLMAPRMASLTHGGFVRERVEALRAGWPLDPPISETLPLQSLMLLAAGLPGLSLRLMNLSTADGVERLRQEPDPPQASVCWWHLIADSGCLDPADEGWRLEPALGGPGDREALIAGLADGLITAVAVHHLPLDAEERLLPLDQRRPGLAGHGLVLPMLWKELVIRRGWSPHELWRVVCWGPSRFLGLPVEELRVGSCRWLLFDPSHRWLWGPSSCVSLAANQPCWGRSMEGAVVACGLTDQEDWSLPGGPPR